MKGVIVDTNVLVSFLIDREPEQQAQAGRLLEQAAAGQLRALIHQLVLAELVFVLEKIYSQPAKLVSETLADLLRMPGVELVHELSWSRLLDLWPTQISAFVDASIAAASSETGVDAVATFDGGLRARLRRLGIPSYFAS